MENTENRREHNNLYYIFQSFNYDADFVFDSSEVVPRCPKCGRVYTERPATSRVDGSPICPDCGTREALLTLGIDEAEQEQIIQAIHRSFDHLL